MCCEKELKLARAALTLIERADLKGAEVNGYVNVRKWLESIVKDNEQALEIAKRDKTPGQKKQHDHLHGHPPQHSSEHESFVQRLREKVAQENRLTPPDQPEG